MASSNSSAVGSEEIHESKNGESKASIVSLTDRDKEVIERQLATPNFKIGYFDLFRYADSKNKIIMLVATVASVAAGAVMPLMTLVYGKFAGSFTSFSVDAVAIEHFKHQTNELTLYYIYLGIASFVTSYISIVGFSYTGEKITQRIRELYLNAIFKQNIAFFDFLGSGEVTTRISADMGLVQDGVGQKMGLFIQGISMFIAALIVGFTRSWKLSLIMLSATFAIILMMGVHGSLMARAQIPCIDEYASAASLAEETLSSARNVAAFGTQKRLQEKYHTIIDRAAHLDFKAKFYLSLMIAGIESCVMNLQYALAFWQGKRLIDLHEIRVANVLTVVMALMMAGFSIGQNLPHLQAFGSATGAATKVFNTIERKSPIDPEADDGETPETFTGNIEFRNIKHIYPSRPDTTVLTNFNLQVSKGQMVALVGASGSGKSTIVGLLERFYLPMEGQVLLDGKDISTLNLRWLRLQMALVSQEPVLFSTTIFESIAHGLANTEYATASEEKKMELIESAAKIANAHAFITELPEQYFTKVGGRGNLLSGGQKQRIAIARAIVSDPKILLLDEATAALDSSAERIVQDALDAASEGRTTIVIAHRLSTIRKADKIVVMAEGEIVEQGTHEQLISRDGVYAGLVQTQELTAKLKSIDNRESDPVHSEKVDPEDDDRAALVRTVTSTPSVVISKKNNRKESKYTIWELIKFSWEMNDGDHMTMTIGLLVSFLVGSNSPIQAIFLGNAINSLLSPDTSLGGHGVTMWCAFFAMLGVVMYALYFIQGKTLSKGSARLIGSVRKRAFAAMLRQDMEFFDGPLVSSGALANFLSSEPNRLAGLSGATLGSILSSAANVIIAFIVSASFGWKLALVCSACIPLIVFCGYCRFWSLTRMEKRTKDANDAASFACEAASSIRTVASLSLEKHLLSEYQAKLALQMSGNMKFSQVSAILFATAQGVSMFVFALIFWYGSHLLMRREYSVLQFFIVYSAIINGSQSAGTIFSFAAAQDAATLLKSFLHRIPKIDHTSTDGKKVGTLVGKVELQDVCFTYPGRPDHRILRSVTLSAQPGAFVALVGASGSGKSTIMQLLERFYDPSSGSIMVDDIPVSDYNLQDYRAQLAIVSQETTLYTGTIRDNILADREHVTEEAIVQACRDANIYDFIVSLPDGFNTLVGAKGALLSGGQRQRIAIARALLRNPKVLLLDEATSALDSSSERVVQDALDAAAKGRTTIAIAHRLNTIQQADVIYVFDKGKIVERGTHAKLVSKKGVYWGLAKLQAMGAPQ